MRLINTSTGAFEEFVGRNIPQYAILSHTWEEEEVTYQDYVGGAYTHMKGYDKIRMTCMLAAREGLGYAWCDTCCIDKRSSAELTEAINSMYQWYQRSVVCYAFLSDLPGDAELSEALKTCRWFTRGWTLQELIAPRRVLFFDSHWCERGSKLSLADRISDITHIDCLLLLGKAPLSGYSVAQKMSWAAPRQTTRIEDLAYCLLGIFDLNLPLLYGEEEKAFRRLQEEIIRTTPDLSIFAWQLPQSDQAASPSDSEYGYISNPNERVLCGVLAKSPAEFYDCGGYINDVEDVVNSHVQKPAYILPLICKTGDSYLGILLRQVGPEKYLREDPKALSRYDQTHLHMIVALTLPLEERYLLIRNPKQSNHEDVRFGHASKMLPRVRSHVLQIVLPRHCTHIQPWPSDNYDHTDQLFFSTHKPRHDFSSLKFTTTVPIPTPDGGDQWVDFEGRLCAVGWSAEDPSWAQFSVVGDDAHHRKAFDELSSSASGLNTHGRGIESLLNSCKIPRSSAASYPIPESDSVALVTVYPQFMEDLSISTRRVWNIKLSFNIYGPKDLPTIERSTWKLPPHPLIVDFARALDK